MPSSQHDYEYSAGLSTESVEATIAKIDKLMEELGKQGDDTFKGLGKGAGDAGKKTDETGRKVDGLRNDFLKLAGVLQQIGGNTAIGQLGASINLVAGGVGALLNKFIELATRAREAFEQIHEQAIAMNQEMQSAQFLFSNFFGGGEGGMDQAQALVQELKDLAQQRGLNPADVFSFSQSIAPDAENVGQLKEIITLADVFADLESRAFPDVRRAFDEAVAGQYEIMKDILNISPGAIAKLKDYQKEFGNVEGLIKGLGEYLEGRGLSGLIDQGGLQGSAQLAQKNIEGIKSELLAAYGAAPFEEWNESLNLMGEFLAGNHDQLIDIASAIGDAVASMMDLKTTLLETFGGDVDISDVAKQIESIATDLTEITAQAGALSQNLSAIGDFLPDISGDFNAIDDVFGGIGGIFDSVFNPLPGILRQVADLLKLGGDNAQGIAGWIEKLADYTGGPAGALSLFWSLGDIMRELNIITAQIKAGWVGIVASFEPTLIKMSQAIDLLVTAGDALVSRDYSKLSGIKDAIGELFSGDFIDTKRGAELAMRSYEESMKVIEEADKKVEDLEKRRKRRQEGGSLSDDTELPGANKSGELGADTQKAVEKIDEKLLDYQRDQARKIEDMEIDIGKRRLQLAQDFAEKREQIEQDHTKRLEGIYDKHADAVADEAAKYDQKQFDIDKKYNRDIEDLEADSAKKRAQIEEDYHTRLQEIKDEFNRNAEEAAEDRDAIRYVELVKQRDLDLETAGEQRDQQQDQASEDDADREDELQTRRDRELEDAQEAHAQQLEELQTRLERELEAEDAKYTEDVEKNRTAEQQKLDDLDRYIAEKSAALQLADQRRLEDMQVALSKEVALVQKAEAEKIKAISQTYEAYTKMWSAMGYSPPSGSGASSGKTTTVNVTQNAQVPTSAAEMAQLQDMVNRTVGQVMLAVN